MNYLVVNILMEEYITYELWDPIENIPFYVGAGSQKRPYTHLSEAKNLNNVSHKFNKIRKIWEMGAEPIIKIVYTGFRSSAFDKEISLIKEYGRADLGLGTLTNLTNGGDGGTCGLVDSESTRKKKSESRKGSKNPMFGKNHSKKTRELIKKNHSVCSGINNSRAKRWKLVFPSGEELIIEGNIIPKCKELKIDYSCLLSSSKTGLPLTKGNGKGCILYDLGSIIR